MTKADVNQRIVDELLAMFSSGRERRQVNDLEAMAYVEHCVPSLKDLDEKPTTNEDNTGRGCELVITAQQLQEMDACVDGVATFCDCFGEEWRVVWDVEAQLHLIRGPLRPYFGWAVTNCLLPLWSMSCADLRGCDLSKVDLSHADLCNADLRGCDLSDADLHRTDLRCADLRDADLRGCDLSDADLRCAYLRDADLSGCDLRDADLSGADLRGADLRCAYLSHADLRDADLRCAYLSHADLRDADLRDADFCDADWG